MAASPQLDRVIGIMMAIRSKPPADIHEARAVLDQAFGEFKPAPDIHKGYRVHCYHADTILFIYTVFCNLKQASSTPHQCQHAIRGFTNTSRTRKQIRVMQSIVIQSI